MAAAALVGAVAERAQQIGLRAPDQTNARPPRNRKPLFQRQPAGKATFAFGHGCSLILPPRDSGEGRTIRSSRSERRMVGGARASTILCNDNKASSQRPPPPCFACARMVPLPRYRGGG